MPRIPTYDRSENVAGRPQPFSTGDGYAAPGRAMQQLGEGIQKLGHGFDVALNVAQKEKDEEDRFKMNMEWLKFTSQQDLYQTDYDKKITGDGSSHVPGRMEGYDAAFGEFYGRVAPQSPRLRRELQLRGMQYRGQVQQRTSRTAEGHRDFYFSSVAEKGITGTVLPRVTYDITTARQGLDLAEGIIASAPITEQRKAQLRDRAAAAILDAWKDRAFKAYEAEGIGDPAKMVEEQLKKYGDSFKPSPTQPQKPGAPDALPPPSGEKPTTGSYTMPPSARDDRRIPASLRYNNPGAQWPGPSSRKFGAVGFVTLRDGQGNKIAVFDTFEQGAAAQFDLLYRKYAGKPLTRLLTIWSGGNHPAAYTRSVAGEMGIKPDTIITREMLRDPKIAIPLARAMARVESGREHPAPVRAWQTAHRMALGGPQASQPASAIPAPSMPEDQPAVPYGPDAETQPQQQKYVTDVPGQDEPVDLGAQPGAPIQVAEAPPPWVSGAPRTTTDYFARRLWLDNDKIRRQADVIGKKRLAFKQAEELVKGVMGGTRDLNLHADAERKMVDAYFKATPIGQKVFAGDPQAISGAIFFAQRANYLPASLAEGLRGLAHSPDAKKRALGLTAIGSIIERAPFSLSETQGGADLVKDAVRFNVLRTWRKMSSEAAIQFLEYTKSKEYQAVRKEAEGKPWFKSAMQGKTVDDVTRGIGEIGMSRFLPGFLGGTSTPTATPAMGGLPVGHGSLALLVRAKDIYKDHLLTFGEGKETEAWKATMQELRSMHFSSSALTGKPVVMRHAPETVFPMLTAYPRVMEFAQEDLVASIKKATKQDITLGDIYLSTDPRTMREVEIARAGGGDGKVTWAVTVKDKTTGAFRTLRERYYFDPQGLRDRMLKERKLQGPSVFDYDPITPGDETPAFEGDPVRPPSFGLKPPRREPSKRSTDPTQPIIR